METFDCKTIEDRIDYHSFKNQLLIKQAFTRRSYTNEHGGENQEVLEFLGDNVLDFYVTKMLIETHSNFEKKKSTSLLAPCLQQNEEFISELNEEELTELKKHFVERKYLARCIDRMELAQYLRMGKGDRAHKADNAESVKEDLFEAIVGAITLDSNWDAEKIENSIREMLDFDATLWEGFNGGINYVEEIQKWTLRRAGRLPNYTYSTYSTFSNPSFSAHLAQQTSDGVWNKEAEGRSKSEARAKLAKEFYEYLVAHDDLYSVVDDMIEHLSLNNAINKLQECAQKGLCHPPKYDFKEPLRAEDGKIRWECECSIWTCKKDTPFSNSGIVIETPSRYIQYDGIATSKIDAKKKAAYAVLMDFFRLEEVNYGNNGY